MSKSSVTLLDLSRRLNLSKATVSLALRGQTMVAEKTRARVLEEARRCGYKANPVTTGLMSMLHAGKSPAEGNVVVFLNIYRPPALLREVPDPMRFVTGATAQAAKFGYRVEVIDAFGSHSDQEKIRDQLRADGVRGILVGPRSPADPPLDFRWEEFSVVLVGEIHHPARLYRACNHHIRSAMTVLRTLEARGYHRIGLLLRREDRANRGCDYLIAARQFTSEGHPDVAIASALYEALDADEIRSWAVRERLEAVVSLEREVGPVVASLPPLSGRPISYACLCVHPGEPWAGIDQRFEVVGAEAFNLLRGLLHSGERGESSYRRVLLIEGRWVDGRRSRGLEPANSQFSSPSASCWRHWNGLLHAAR